MHTSHRNTTCTSEIVACMTQTWETRYWCKQSCAGCVASPNFAAAINSSTCQSRLLDALTISLCLKAVPVSVEGTCVAFNPRLAGQSAFIFTMAGRVMQTVLPLSRCMHCSLSCLGKKGVTLRWRPSRSQFPWPVNISAKESGISFQ